MVTNDERQPLVCYNTPCPCSPSSRRQSTQTSLTSAIGSEDSIYDPYLYTKASGHVHKNSSVPRVGREPPPYVACLSPEGRQEAEKSLVHKIDIRLIPPIITMYILNYIDRNAIATARLGGLDEDLKLKGNQYQACVSILFVGYILMQVPSNLLMNKLGRPSLYLSIAMMIWGVLSGLTATVHSFAGLFIVRFFLGFAESPFFPGALYLLSCFYTRKELALRTAMLYAGSLISGAFAGLIAAGITQAMDGLLGLRAWRWLFILEGCSTVVIAFSCVWILPDMPKNTRWLTPEQRELASWRMDEDIGEDDWTGIEDQGFWSGLFLAVTDTKTWIMAILIFCMVFSGSITNFFPTIVQTLGYDRIESLLLTAPPYVLGVITCAVNAWHSDRSGEKYFHITVPLYLAAASFVLAATTTATTPRYFAMVLMISGCYAGYVVALGWISSTIFKPPTKRSAAIALINCLSNSSSIFFSFLLPESAAPWYTMAFVFCSVSSFIAICAATVLRLWLARLNRKLECGGIVEGVAGGGKFRFML